MSAAPENLLTIALSSIYDISTLLPFVAIGGRYFHALNQAVSGLAVFLRSMLLLPRIRRCAV